MICSRACRVGLGWVLGAHVLHATAAEASTTFSTYFNHRPEASFVEPHRGMQRAGDNFEQVIVQRVAAARTRIDVAVMGITLPHIAQALAQAARRGVQVRVVMDNSFRRNWAALTPDEVASLSDADNEVWAEVERLFRVMVEVWQPEWATVSHTDMSDPEPASPVHWMLYGRESLPPGLVLPEGVEVHGLTGASGEVLAPGQYVVTTPGERFVYSHPEHKARCEALKRVLREAGWLPPATQA